MKEVFLNVLRMSVTSTVVILAVILARVLMRRAPKKYSFLLWSVVGFRLLCPVSVKGALSLFNLAPKAHLPEAAPRPTPVPPNMGFIPGETAVPSQAIPTDVRPSVIPPAEPSIDWMQILAVLWLAGMVCLFIYALVSELRLRRSLATATRMEGNVYQSELVRSPFLLGVFRPRIYIPYGLEPQAQSYVLAHERHHLHRKDHLTRRLAFLLLTIHWFDPFCWLAYHLFSKDMELSCDEAVLGQGISTADYSDTLLSFAVKRDRFSPVPLAFGETGVKTRIRNVLRWHRPKMWATALALVLSTVVVIACATDARPDAVTGEEAIAALEDSIRYDETSASFTFKLPELSDTPQIHIAGRVEDPDMGGMSVHYLDNEDYYSGKEYTFTLYDTDRSEATPIFTELFMTVTIGESERDIDLLPYLGISSSGEDPIFEGSIPPTQNEEVKNALLYAALHPDEVGSVASSQIIFESSMGEANDVRMVVLRFESRAHAGGFGSLVLGTLSRSTNEVQEAFLVPGDDGRLVDVSIDEAGIQHIQCTNSTTYSGVTEGYSSQFLFDGRSLRTGEISFPDEMKEELLSAALYDPEDSGKLHILGLYPVGEDTLAVTQYLSGTGESDTMITALCDLEKEQILGTVYVLPGGTGRILRSYNDPEGRLHVECMDLEERMPEPLKHSAHYVAYDGVLLDLEYSDETERNAELLADTMDRLIRGVSAEGNVGRAYNTATVTDTKTGNTETFRQHTSDFMHFYGTPGQRMTRPYTWVTVDEGEAESSGDGERVLTISGGGMSLTFYSGERNYVTVERDHETTYLRGDVKAGFAGDIRQTIFEQNMEILSNSIVP